MIITQILNEINMRPSTIKSQITTLSGLVGFELECVIDEIKEHIDQTLLLTDINSLADFEMLFDMSDEASDVLSDVYQTFCDDRGISGNDIIDPFFVRQFFKKFNLKKFIKQFDVKPTFGWHDETLGSFFSSDQKKGRVSKKSINKYIKQQLSKTFTNIQDVVYDGSVKADNGLCVEIITKPLPFSEAIAQLNLLKDFLVTNYNMRTNSTTGFHINVSLTKPEMDNIDLCKLLVIFDEDYLIRQFGRENNQYAQKQENIFQKIPESLKQTGDLEKIKNWINKQLRRQHYNADAKYHTFNIRYPRHENYIEFRVVGGDYLNKWQQCLTAIDRCIYITSVAVDSEKERDNYHKKLYKKIHEKETDA